ncbi:hypothetical protein I4U23_000069 [Adineta vaga]|nr:hypothetical protein I4U23_000069 [Adineta vaga]
MSALMDDKDLIGYSVKGDRINASYDSVWDAMMDSVYHPENYIPRIKMISLVDKGDHFVREATMGHKGTTIEEIVCDKEVGEIRFSAQVKLTIVYKYNRDTRVLEQWLELDNGFRLPWFAPKSAVETAIQKTKELAEAESK